MMAITINQLCAVDYLRLHDLGLDCHLLRHHLKRGHIPHHMVEAGGRGRKARIFVTAEVARTLLLLQRFDLPLSIAGRFIVDIGRGGAITLTCRTPEGAQP